MKRLSIVAALFLVLVGFFGLTAESDSLPDYYGREGPVTWKYVAGDQVNDPYGRAGVIIQRRIDLVDGQDYLSYLIQLLDSSIIGLGESDTFLQGGLISTCGGRYQRTSFRAEWWSYLDAGLNWEMVGNGGGKPLVREVRLMTRQADGTTPTSTYKIMRSSEDAGWVNNGLDWDRIIVFQAQVSHNIHGDHASRITFGKNQGDNLGPLYRKGIGFAFTQNDVYAIANTGLSLVNDREPYFYNTGFPVGPVYLLTVASFGDGCVEWLINGAEVKNIADGPIGHPLNFGDVIVQGEIHNMEPALAEMVVHGFRVYVQQ